MGKIKILVFEKESKIILEVDSSSKISEGKKNMNWKLIPLIELILNMIILGYLKVWF